MITGVSEFKKSLNLITIQIASIFICNLCFQELPLRELQKNQCFHWFFTLVPE